MTETIHKVKNFSKSKLSFSMPHLLTMQRETWEDFWKVRVKELLSEISPIIDYTEKEFELWFLDYKLGKKALDGCYQVTDFLPSGLKPVTRMNRGGQYDLNIWYPYFVKGQEVSFCVYNNEGYKPINYYARVISAGDYLSENAYIQSLSSTDSFNVSTTSQIKIK